MVSVGLSTTKDGIYWASMDGAIRTGFIKKFSLGNRGDLNTILSDADEISIVTSHFSTYPNQPKRISCAANTAAAIGFICRELGKPYRVIDDNDICRALHTDWASLPSTIADISETIEDSRGMMLAIYGAWSAYEEGD